MSKRIRNRDMEAVRRAMGFDPRNPVTGITLGDVEAAYVTMVETEFAAAVQVAQQKRSERFAVVMKTHSIPEGSRVTIVPAANGEPMRLDVTPPAGMSANNPAPVEAAPATEGNGTGTVHTANDANDANDPDEATV